MVVYADTDFARLPPHVVQLFERAGKRNFFAQLAWFALVARNGRHAQSRVYVDAEPAAVALVMRTEQDRGLHGLSNAYSMDYGPICETDEADVAALRRLVAGIANEDSRREMIALAALDSGAPSYDALLEGLRAAGWAVKPFFDCGNWYEVTAGVDFRTYFASRPKMLSNTVRRKEKAAVREGVEYEFSEPNCDLERLIADYETVYRHSWKTAEPSPTFMPELIRLSFGLGALRMGVARIGGTPAAAQFWLLWQGRAVIYKLAHDERFTNLSLGTLLTMRMMERVLEQDRPAEVNFGRGDDPYKKLWLPRRRERWGILAANPRTLRGRIKNARWMAGRIRDRLFAVGHRPAPGIPAA